LTNTGMLDGSSATASDVADQWFADKEKTIHRRRRFRSDNARPERIDGMRLVREIDLEAEDDETEGEGTSGAAPERPGQFWRWYVRPRSGDDDASKTAETPVTWQDHTKQVARYAAAIAARLGLPPDLQKVLELAARFHDLGKKRELWQRSIGNPNPADWHAKSGKDWKPLEITDYRHEFGSLIDVLDPKQPFCQELDALEKDSAGMKDLVLHLIAAHHGRGRPHFPQREILDPEPKQADASRLAAEVPRRFARLQRRYGRWGLAYLESLLRAADYAASANPTREEESST
jgi:CRISPR-associated endonuclease/helicase Cas3